MSNGFFKNVGSGLIGGILEKPLEKLINKKNNKNRSDRNNNIYQKGDRGIEGIEGPRGIIGPEGPIGSVGPVGPQGLTGDQGPIGLNGPKGIQGEQGNQGNQGPIGPEGPAGLQGPEGPEGPVGSKGDIGEIGLQGPKGEQGERGPIGPQGETGPQGSEGPRGLQGEPGIDGVKTFVINHPLDENKYLVHACLEGPEVGVYYRGRSKIEDGNNKVTIKLPKYFSELVNEESISIQLQMIGKIPRINDIVTFYEHNCIYVSGSSGEFYWHIYAERKNANLKIEPNKNDCEIKGIGPYTYLD